MILSEPVEIINQRLIDYFGKFETGDANYRVVWSEDQFEKRICDFGSDGLFLLTPEIREEKKYTYIHNKYILEKLFPVPAGCGLTTSVSYEPIWTFEDKDHNALPPKWEAIEILIYTIHNQMAKAGMGIRYKEPEIEGSNPEAVAERIRIIEEELFGNETRVGDALATDRAVGYGIRQRQDSKN